MLGLPWCVLYIATSFGLFIYFVLLLGLQEVHNNKVEMLHHFKMCIEIVK